MALFSWFDSRWWHTICQHRCHRLDNVNHSASWGINAIATSAHFEYLLIVNKISNNKVNYCCSLGTRTVGSSNVLNTQRKVLIYYWCKYVLMLKATYTLDYFTSRFIKKDELLYLYWSPRTGQLVSTNNSRNTAYTKQFEMPKANDSPESGK